MICFTGNQQQYYLMRVGDSMKTNPQLELQRKIIKEEYDDLKCLNSLKAAALNNELDKLNRKKRKGRRIT